MSIFKNPDFFDLKPLDLENKLILPTRELYANVSLQLNELYQHIKAVLIDWHGEMAATAKQFYAHPVETTSQWYAQAVDQGAQMYARLNEVYLPKAEAVYEQSLAEAAQLGRQAGEHWQAFYDHPQATVATLVEPVTNYANHALEVSEAYLMSIYSAMLELFDLLLEQPSQTLEAVYQNALAGLLDGYYQLVSSLLTML
ncbi:MAG: hypothetical protein IBX56_04515 [Methylomicrobium sp.]|nr:hypothetical protein [Methylomicrobium sp.]